MNDSQFAVEDAVAIVGMAGRFPGANSVEELWQGLLEGVDGVRLFTESEIHPVDRAITSDGNYVPARGIVDGAMDFDAEFFGISPMEARIMDPQHRVLIQLTWHLFENAGINIRRVDDRVGVFVGSNWNRYQSDYLSSPSGQQLVKRFGELNSSIANEHDFPATRLAYLFNFRGPCINLLTACSTGLVGVCQGVSSLLNFESDCVVAGGVSLNPPSNRGYLYNEGGMLSRDGRTRPFDAEASGTTFNEGAALVLLKRLEDAQNSGDTIHGVILGAGINNDGNSKVSFTAPSVGGQADALRLALGVADVEPESVTHIEAHGTATPLGDPVEVAALKEVYGRGEVPCFLGSIKGNIGHLIHAAGTASLIKMALSLRHATIPGVQNYVKPNPNLGLEGTRFAVNSQSQAWDLPNGMARRGAVSSFGVGGTNAHVLLQEWPEYRESDRLSRVPALLLSARTEGALDRLAKAMIGRLTKVDAADTADAAYTVLKTREPHAFRGALLGAPECWPDVAAERALKSNPGSAWTAAKAGAATDCVFMFPGQGAQQPGMAAGFVGQLESVGEDVRRMLAAAGEREAILTELLFHADPEDYRAQEKLRQTELAQPALFAVSWALGNYWINHGLEPAALIGHSIGEFAAGCISGMWSPEVAMKIVCRRGELMQAQEPGSMLAVRSGFSDLSEHLPPELSLAAVNGPRSVVVAGKTPDVEAFATSLKQRGTACQILNTSHAFHSTMMKAASDELEEYLSGVRTAPPGVPIISTVTGERLSDTDAVSPSYWARQLAQPVDFLAALTTLNEDARDLVFLEAGPGSTLASLARGLPLEQRHAVTASHTLKSAAIDSLAGAWGALWTSGLPLDADRIYADEKRRRIPLPGYEFEPTTYCVDEPEGTGMTINQTKETSEAKISEPEVGEPPQNVTSPLREQLREMLEEYSGISVVPDQDDLSFLELGLDSLLLTQVSRTVSSEFGVSISFRDLSEEYNTVSSLAAYLAEKNPALAVSAPATPVQSDQNMQVMAQMTGLPTSGEPGAALNALIQNQLEIMRLQLQALGGTGELPAALGEKKLAVQSSTASKAIDLPAEVQQKLDQARRRGPGTRISSQAGELTERQKSALMAIQDRYVARTPASKAFAQEHRTHFADPRTVSGFNPLWKEMVYPIVTRRSSGAKLWDIDGNEYIDLTNGFGQILFGHSPAFITEAVKAQIDLGVEIGPQTELAGEVAQLLCEMTGNERMTFANTGSEAVLAAIRLARTVTNRTRVVSFEQAYHGIFDEVIVRGGKTGQALPGAPGIPRSVSDNVMVLPWADMDMIDVIRSQASEIAAVMVEPVQSRAPDIQPAEFLKQLRAVTEENGIALIFDEVVTGFRCAPGGAQEYFGIRADLATYGKILGGGYPIGVVAGKAKYMDAMDGGQWRFGDESSPEVGVTFFAGTFVRHPLAMAASRAVLRHLKEQGGGLQQNLNQTTADFCAELNLRMRRLGVDIRAQVFSSVFYFDLEVPFAEVFFSLLREQGVHIWSHRPCFLTQAHTPEMLEQLLAAFETAAAEMVANDLLDARAMPPEEQFLPENRPATDAKLGRDEQGNPAWYVKGDDGNYVAVSLK